LIFAFILRLFVSPPDKYEAKIGSLTVAVTKKSVFSYKVPVKGSLVFSLDFSNTAPGYLNRTDLVSDDQFKAKDDQIRGLCAKYGVGLTTLEGEQKNYRCTTAFLAGIHQSKLYDEETGVLLGEFNHPNGAGGFKLLIINGIPEGRVVRLEVQTLSFEDPDNELAVSIAQSLTEPLPDINTKKTADVLATLRPWKKDRQGNIPIAVQGLTEN